MQCEPTEDIILGCLLITRSTQRRMHSCVYPATNKWITTTQMQMMSKRIYLKVGFALRKCVCVNILYVCVLWLLDFCTRSPFFFSGLGYFWRFLDNWLHVSPSTTKWSVPAEITERSIPLFTDYMFVLMCANVNVLQKHKETQTVSNESSCITFI